MRGLFELKATILEKEYEVKSILGMDTLTTYCEEKGIKFEDLFKLLSNVGSSSNTMQFITLVKDLVFFGHESYGEFYEVERLTRKQVSIIIDNAGEIETVVTDFAKVLIESLPKISESKVASKKK